MWKLLLIPVFLYAALLVLVFAFQARLLFPAGAVGGADAAPSAPRRPLHGLILVTPFDSLGKVVEGQFPWLPVRWLFRHEMKPAEWLRTSAVPTAIIAAEGDTLIPPARTEGLRRAAARLVYDRTISGAGHNDIYDRPEFRTAMREALARVGG
jgi:uncharacterized protein